MPAPNLNNRVILARTTTSVVAALYATGPAGPNNDNASPSAQSSSRITHLSVNKSPPTFSTYFFTFPHYVCINYVSFLSSRRNGVINYHILLEIIMFLFCFFIRSCVFILIVSYKLTSLYTFTPTVEVTNPIRRLTKKLLSCILYATSPVGTKYFILKVLVDRRNIRRGENRNWKRKILYSKCRNSTFCSKKTRVARRTYLRGPRPIGLKFCTRSFGIK